MSEAQKRRNDWAVWTAGTVALVAVYVGAYALVVKQLRLSLEPGGGGVGWLIPNTRAASEYESLRVYPAYSGNERFDPWLRRFFEPVHQLDRRLRPNIWRWDSPPPDDRALSYAYGMGSAEDADGTQDVGSADQIERALAPPETFDAAPGFAEPK